MPRCSAMLTSYSRHTQCTFAGRYVRNGKPVCGTHRPGRLRKLRRTLAARGRVSLWSPAASPYVEALLAIGAER